MKIVTSVTIFNDAVGLRMSATYSEVDQDGRIISDNKRIDRVVTDDSVKAQGQAVMAYAAELLKE